MRLPGVSNRTVIIGRTGSGKTRFGFWLLGRMPVDKMPWIIINSKGEELFDKIPGVKPLGISSAPPTKPGIYMVSPTPHQIEELDELLWKVWANGNTGVFIDEGYMLRESNAMNALQTQGRSKHIPIITCTQRPVWLSRFVFSEASYFCVFALTDERDKKTVQSFVPFNVFTEMPEFCSRWYDVGNNASEKLRPVPPEKVTIEELREKIGQKRDRVRVRLL